MLWFVNGGKQMVDPWITEKITIFCDKRVQWSFYLSMFCTTTIDFLLNLWRKHRESSQSSVMDCIWTQRPREIVRMSKALVPDSCLRVTKPIKMKRFLNWMMILLYFISFFFLLSLVYYDTTLKYSPYHYSMFSCIVGVWIRGHPRSLVVTCGHSYVILVKIFAV